MKIRAGETNIRVQGKELQSIAEVQVGEYTVYVFPGSLSPNDILIKYKKGAGRMRTPQHIHWAVDILLKRENDKALTAEFLQAIEKLWRESKPLKDRKFETLKSLLESGEGVVDLKHFAKLNKYGEYDVDFIYALMRLLATQEKTNYEGAYMFGNVIEQLLKEELDVFKVVSTAGFGGRR